MSINIYQKLMKPIQNVQKAHLQGLYQDCLIIDFPNDFSTQNIKLTKSYICLLPQINNYYQTLLNLIQHCIYRLLIQCIIIIYFNSHMDLRMFGKQITNLIEAEPRNRKSYSYIHAEKLKEQQNQLNKPTQLNKQNRSFSAREEPSNLLAPLASNLQMVPQYFQQCIKHLKMVELEHHKPINYLTNHKSITEQQRSKLVDWVTKLHYKFKMFPETLFTIVSLVDQYLALKQIPLSQLQLVGIAAIFIAAKFQQTYQVPPLKQLISCCASLYTNSQILEKEADIIKQLSFNLIVSNTYKFFEPFSKVIGLQAKNHHLAHYVLELALLQPKFLVYPPSLMAASAIYLIKKIRKGESSWSDSMTHFVGYEERQLKVCAKELCALLELAPQLQNSRNIKEKFSQPSFHEVTRIKLQRKEKK